MPSPSGPAPAMTTTSSSLISAALHRVDRAGQRLDEGRVFGCDRLRHLVVERIGGQQHILGPGALGALAEAVDIAVGAHPILAALAVAAVPAGHDLFGNGQVAQGQTVLLAGPFAQRHHLAGKLVAGNHRRLGIARRLAVAPEERRAADSI